MVVSTTHDVLNQVFDSLTDCLTPEVARRIIDIQLDPQSQRRIDELARKANEGTLTPREHDQYAQFVEAIDLLGILQAKAQLVLSRSAR